MRFRVTLKSQTSGREVDLEVESSYNAKSVAEQMAKNRRLLPDNWDVIKCVRVDRQDGAEEISLLERRMGSRDWLDRMDHNPEDLLNEEEIEAATGEGRR
jgi:hypothetical protein